MTRPSAATAKKGVRHPPSRASSSPAGTPSTDAMEKAPITLPSALPRRSAGTASVTMAIESAVAGPPKAPARQRAAIIVPRPEAKPPEAVPTTSPSIATASAARRSKRSRKEAARSPATAAAAV